MLQYRKYFFLFYVLCTFDWWTAIVSNSLEKINREEILWQGRWNSGLSCEKWTTNLATICSSHLLIYSDYYTVIINEDTLQDINKFLDFYGLNTITNFKTFFNQVCFTFQLSCGFFLFESKFVVGMFDLVW